MDEATYRGYQQGWVDGTLEALKQHLTQGEPMTDTVTTTDYEIRLAALDRAIGRLHADREVSPDDVVALAATFEAYLRG